MFLNQRSLFRKLLSNSLMSTSCKVLLALLLFISSLSAFPDPTPYEILESYRLPKGLLPKGVRSYLLRKDGTFDVYFGGVCEFRVKGTYLLRYKRRVSGKLERGAVKELKGVSVKALFSWFGVSRVVRRDDELRFYVGPISVSFPVERFFEDSPICRCLDKVVAGTIVREGGKMMPRLLIKDVNPF